MDQPTPHRPLFRRQTSSSTLSDTEDVFADRFVVSDGFSQADEQLPTRPSRMSTSSDDDEPPITSIDAHFADEHFTYPTPAQRELRNSIRKSRGYLQNPFMGEGEESSSQRRPSSSSLYPPQNTSTAADGPSHDYSRYQQSTPLTRAHTNHSSITAQSTNRQSLQGPAHPYAMYPQNVEDDDLDDNDTDAIQTIPVGFTPTSHYRPDLHGLSEQLPPYSEYPEDGAPKHVDEPASNTPSSTNSTISLALPSAVLSRPPQSMSDAPNDDPSSSAPLLGPTGPKPWKKKSIKEKLNTRVLGIRVLWICVVGGAFFFIAIVLGSVMGGYYSGRARSDGDANASTLLDAVALTSTASPPAPTGTFQLQLGSPQESQNQCLTNATQAPSWSCNLAVINSLAIKVDNLPSSGQAALVVNTEPGAAVGYGAELPDLLFSEELRLVTDKDAVDRGPAWQFQALYNKVVVVEEGAFESAAATSTSSSSSSRVKAMKRGWLEEAAVGSQPWYCYWNSTLLEGFIYTQENSTQYSNLGNSSSSNPLVNENSNNLYRNQVVNSPTTTITSSPTSSPSSTPPSSNQGATVATTASTFTTSASTSSTASSAAASTSTSGADAWAQLSLYPRVVKIEERRLPGDTVKPYCVKMQVLDDLTVSPVLDQSGAIIMFELSEADPGLSAYESAYDISAKKRKRSSSSSTAVSDSSDDEEVYGSCHCQWISGDLQAEESVATTATSTATTTAS